jgi:diguanylate cyclase (GGDEF)-like protein/PAS domain S-box-containing protein
MKWWLILTFSSKLIEIIALLPNPTIITGLDGLIHAVPDGFDLLQLAVKDQQLSAILDTNGCSALTQALHILQTEDHANFEAGINLLNGGPRYAQIALRKRVEDGTTYLIVQFTDITVQRLREADIHKRERLWNDALTISRAGVWDINLAEETVFCSDTWHELRGLSAGIDIDASVYDWVKYVHPDDREMVIHCVERQNQGDPDYNTFTYRIQHNDGHWVWIESRGSCIERHESGEPFRIAGIDSDVTAAMNDKHQLERLSLRLKLALEVSQIGVFEVNFTTGMANWDHRTYEIFDLDPTATINIGETWEQLIHPDDRETSIRNLDDHIERLEPFTCEYRAILQSEREVYVRTRTVPFIDTDGHKKVIGTALDITHDVLMRKELENSKNLLEAHNLELIEARTSIEYNALHDYLTDLPNRRYLDEELARMAKCCEREDLNLAILHVDLDRFKQINDTLGHHMGDVMLQHAATVLKENRRENEFVARIGGDEFVFVALFKSSTRRLTALADQIITELRKPVIHDGHECRFGASIGIATSENQQINYKQMLLNADIALYNAKKSGRNRFELFSEGTQDWIINIKRVSDEILLALERDEFIPYYQLQFDARTLNVCGVETLARWQHPLDGTLTPGRFLNIAEDLDVMADIDALILDKALRDLRYWRQLGLNIPRISVNVSARRLYDPNLLASLERLAIRPGELYFELLESIFLDETNEIVTCNLKGLRRMNIGIEVDDFGTGHASIVSLLKISPSTLKVDRALIQHATSSTEQRKLLSAIIEMGHSLGISVLGEGVETTDQIATLRELGCDALQGYALCRPMPCEQLINFVRTEQWRSVNIGTFAAKQLHLAS